MFPCQLRGSTSTRCPHKKFPHEPSRVPRQFRPFPGSSPTETARVVRPTGPPPKRTRPPGPNGQGDRDHACPLQTHRGRPVPRMLRMPSPRTCAQSCTRRNKRLAIRGVPREREAFHGLHPSQAPHSASQRCAQRWWRAPLLGVVLKMARKSKTITQWSRQQAGACGCSHHGERRERQRNRRSARPFTHHDIHSEIFHREVQHLLRGARKTMNLVNEKDITLCSEESTAARSPGC